MSVNAVTTPFQYFIGLDGLPLEDGYIYIGEVDKDAQTNPISIYWDNGLTVPAYQPIRTISGYISKNGSPATLYANADYSITVRDKNGVLVYNAVESNNLFNMTGAVENSPLKAAPDTDDVIPIIDNTGTLKHIEAHSIFDLVHDSAAKTPTDNDELMLLDSAATYTTKKFTWATLKATLKTYLDTLYVALLGDQTIAGIKTFSSSPIIPDATTATQSLAYGQVAVANSALIKTAINAGGAAPIYACRAWCNFSGVGGETQSGTYVQSGTVVTVTIADHGYSALQSVIIDITSGTAVDGTYTILATTDNSFTYTAGTSLSTSGNVTARRVIPTIRASGNVSSITDGGVGIYTANLTAAIEDTDGAAIVTQDGLVVQTIARGPEARILTNNTISIKTWAGGSTAIAADADYIQLAVFR